MRIAIAKFGQETSAFSPVATTLDTFRVLGIYEGRDMLDEAKRVGSIAGFLEAVDEAGIDWTPLPLFRAWAGASGVITADTLGFFEDKLRAGLHAAHPVDAFYFDLHGAGQAENEPDTEGYLLAISREILGDDVPIVIALDHHANVTQRMIDCVDGLVGHRTQPHNPFETGKLAGKMLCDLLQGKNKPTVAWQKIPLITHQEQFLTSKGPMKVWFDLARDMEARPNVISASTFPMQPWLDVPEGGWAAVVVTDNDPSLAEELAAELAQEAWDLRAAFLKQDSISPEEAIQRAVAAEKGLVVLSDTGDSVWGGASGDSTIILREMLRQQITQTALVPMVDAEVVDMAIRAGEGNTITALLGGKLDPNFAGPVEITARVEKIGGGRIKAEFIGMESFDMGRAVLLKSGSIHIVVSETRAIGGNHPSVYRHFGSEPADAKMAVLKTASNWQYFQDMTSAVIRVDTPGATMSQLQQFNWRQLPRPIYPLDALDEWEAKPPADES
jgi:microcystin degradation protein MlrC